MVEVHHEQAASRRDSGDSGDVRCAAERYACAPRERGSQPCLDARPCCVRKALAARGQPSERAISRRRRSVARACPPIATRTCRARRRAARQRARPRAGSRTRRHRLGVVHRPRGDQTMFAWVGVTSSGSSRRPSREAPALDGDTPCTAVDRLAAVAQRFEHARLGETRRCQRRAELIDQRLGSGASDRKAAAQAGEAPGLRKLRKTISRGWSSQAPGRRRAPRRRRVAAAPRRAARRHAQAALQQAAQLGDGRQLPVGSFGLQSISEPGAVGDRGQQCVDVEAVDGDERSAHAAGHDRVKRMGRPGV